MTTNDEMTIDEVYKYQHKIQSLYEKADKKQRGQYLNEMAAITGRNRDYLIHLLKGSLIKRYIPSVKTIDFFPAKQWSSSSVNDIVETPYGMPNSQEAGLE